MYLSNALERIQRTTHSSVIEQESSIPKRLRLNQGDRPIYGITMSDLTQKIWTKKHSTMDNFTAKVVRIVRARTNKQLRDVCFYVGILWFNGNDLNECPTMFRRRIECNASKHTPFVYLFIVLTNYTTTIVYSSLDCKKIAVKQNVFALMRWIVLYNGNELQIPPLVGVGNTWTDIEPSAVAPISPVVAWIHYASVFHEHVERVRSYDSSGTAVSIVAQRAQLPAIEEWEWMVNENKAITIQEVIGRLGWPDWLLCHTLRLMADTHALFWCDAVMFPPALVHHSQIKDVRIVAIVYDCIGQDQFHTVFGC